MNASSLVGGGLVVEGNHFHHFADVWILSALTARWKRLQPKLNSEARSHEDPCSYWGMAFGPPRRGHMAAAYQSKYLIVFGGITNDDVELNDVWVFHFPTLEWKKFSADPETKHAATSTRGHRLLLSRLLLYYGWPCDRKVGRVEAWAAFL